MTPKVVNLVYQAQAIQNRVMQPHEPDTVVGCLFIGKRPGVWARRTDADASLSLNRTNPA